MKGNSEVEISQKFNQKVHKESTIEPSFEDIQMKINLKMKSSFPKTKSMRKTKMASLFQSKKKRNTMQLSLREPQTNPKKKYKIQNNNNSNSNS